MLNITAIGFLGNDAILKEVNGKKVTNFSIAHSEKYKNAEGMQVEKTTWIECSMWDSENVSKYLKKGTQVHITGTPDARAYKNKQDEACASLHVRVVRMELLGAAPKNDAVQNEASKVTEKAQAPVHADDDLPF